MNLPEEIVQSIVDDLRDRQSLGNVWDSIEADIQQEIFQEWKRLTKNRIEVFLDEVFEDDDEVPPENGELDEG